MVKSSGTDAAVARSATARRLLGRQVRALLAPSMEAAVNAYVQTCTDAQAHRTAEAVALTVLARALLADATLDVFSCLPEEATRASRHRHEADLPQLTPLEEARVWMLKKRAAASQLPPEIAKLTSDTPTVLPKLGSRRGQVAVIKVSGEEMFDRAIAIAQLVTMTVSTCALLHCP